MRAAVALPLVGAAVLTAGALIARTLRRSGADLGEAAAGRLRSLPKFRPQGLPNGSLPERLRKRGF